MRTDFPYTIFPCGDHAVTLDFGNVINENINRYVLQLFQQFKQKNIPGVKDVIPAYSSITLVYDVVKVREQALHTTAYNFIQQQVEMVVGEKIETVQSTNNVIKIPACYDESLAPDLLEMALQKNMSIADIVKIHSGKTYRVFMLGFLPGFAYMGTVDNGISMPRRVTPRIKVAQGGIGIAGTQTGIYPVESPGGWNIIAQTPVKLFDAAKQMPLLLQAGDYVQFYPVTLNEFNQIKAEQ